MKEGFTMSKIVAVSKDSNKEIVLYKLDNGEILDRHEACVRALKGELEGVVVQTSRAGETFLRATPDENLNNNLSELPEF